MNALQSLDDVPDPTDFPPPAKAPGLRGLDSSLRCTICGELFDGPVTLPCGHCFCSCCIRTAMAVKQECPTCRKVANEGHLRPTLVVEEAVTAWKAARPYILQLCTDEEKHKIAQEQLPVSKNNAKKRKRTHEAPSSSSSEVECIPGPSRLPNSSATKHAILPKTPAKSRKRKPLSVPVGDVPTSDTNEEEVTAIESLTPNLDDVVNCPMCNKRINFKNINSHMDSNCKDSVAQSKAQWSKILGPKQKGKQKKAEDSDDASPLPKASYDTLKDKRLKEMLLEHELLTTGDRSQLIERHRRWVMIYNANLDRSLSNRKTKGELRRELKKWEEDMKKKKSAVDDVAAYERKQNSEFERLIHIARQSKGKPPDGASSNASKSASGTPAPQGDISSAPGQPSSPIRPPSSSSLAEYDNIIVMDSEGEQELHT